MKDMAAYGTDLLRQFKKYIRAHKPFIACKSAVTLDGRIAAKSGDSRWISSEYSRFLVHKLRAKADAVIVGKNTYTRDNPSLTVRLDSFGGDVRDYFRDNAPAMSGRDNFFLRSLFTEEVTDARMPLRVVVGLPDIIDMTNNIFSDGNYLFFERRRAVDTLIRSNPGLADKIDDLHLIQLEAESPVEEIGEICDELHGRGIVFALVEGGGRLAGSFFDAGELDQLFYVIAPKIVGGGIPSIEAAGVESIGDALKLSDVSVMPVWDDIVYNGYTTHSQDEMK
jgi:diaminohydroxyphosphoribosylaminopyrimidine deaminase/5-amino-6-(5-phosphoribosylamino)uracil reductase